MEIIYSSIVSFCLGLIIMYIFLQNKLNTSKQLDYEILEQNAWLQEENLKLQTETASLNAKKEEMLSGIENLQKQSESAAEAIYQAHIRTMEESFANSAEKLGLEYQEMEKDYKQQYLSLLEESVQEYVQIIEEKKEELNRLSQKILNLKNGEYNDKSR